MLAAGARGNSPPVDPAEVQGAIEAAVAHYRTASDGKVRPDFAAAVERFIRALASDGGMPGVVEDEVRHLNGLRGIYVLARDLLRNPNNPGHHRRLDVVDLWPLVPDRCAQRIITCWRAKLEHALGDRANDLIVDFSDKTESLDARDDSLRRGSTDFGNFIADAVRAGLQADVAIIPSGFFRADQVQDARILRRHLEESFAYDHPTSIVAIDLSRAEALQFYAHAVTLGGQGGFAQVSHPREAVERFPSEHLRVATTRHLIEDATDQDGYRAILADARRKDVSDLVIAVADTAGIVDLVAAGAGQVCLDGDVRIKAAALAGFDATARAFIGLVDAFVELCRQAGLNDNQMLVVLFDPWSFDDWLASCTINNQPIDIGRLSAWRDEIIQAIEKILRLVYPIRARYDADYHPLYKRLLSGREQYQKGIYYSKYLDIAGELVVKYATIRERERNRGG